MSKVGVLTLQGGYQKHIETLKRLKADVITVRSLEELNDVSALVIPGGESTTIGKLLDRFDMLEPLKQKISDGLPVFGTCAGMILLSKVILGYSQFKLDKLDVEIERNGYGRQIESFVADIPTDIYPDNPVKGVFIRAPKIRKLGSEVKVLAKFDGEAVLVQQKNILAASFHPELTDDDRIHEYFLKMIDLSND